VQVLKVKELTAGYGRVQVIYDIDMVIEGGELVAVVGPNGSGKSTLLKAISGLATIHRGKIYLGGMDITNEKAHIRARLGIAYLPQVGNVFPNLTVKENLVLSGYILDKNEVDDRINEVLELFSVLKNYLSRKAMTLSGGERQMLALAMALIRRPKILLLDEPTANLAPKVAIEVLRTIKALKEDLELPIVLVEQNAKKALEVSDRAYLLVSGRTTFAGPSRELYTHPELGKLYLNLK